MSPFFRQGFISNKHKSYLPYNSKGKILSTLTLLSCPLLLQSHQLLTLKCCSCYNGVKEQEGEEVECKVLRDRAHVAHDGVVPGDQVGLDPRQNQSVGHHDILVWQLNVLQHGNGTCHRHFRVKTLRTTNWWLTVTVSSETQWGQNLWRDTKAERKSSWSSCVAAECPDAWEWDMSQTFQSQDPKNNKLVTDSDRVKWNPMRSRLLKNSKSKGPFNSTFKISILCCNKLD